ncbi:MAG: tRNA uridine-5-carboxymethylaminomethyl(34) synthesis GTPase MnmE [Limnochordia bacterium]
MELDTIAAIATAPGEGGIGIIRVSGPDGIGIVEEIFRGKTPLSKLKSHQMAYGHIYDGENPIDEVLVVAMRAPHSYTREDVVEIHCHGGSLPVRRILELVLARGVRMAEPGEFTKRAFLNGRLDLTQAEAVLDIIRSHSDQGMRAAVTQLQGGLGKYMGEIRRELIELLAQLEALLDFPEDDIPGMEREAIDEILSRAEKKVARLLEGASRGRVLREGVYTVIIGPPNVGKSTLLNTLLQEERAIVTAIPGTTRDVIEEMVNIGGVTLRLADTAGVRATSDVVEQLGVERSIAYLERADLVLLVLDGSQELGPDEWQLIEKVVGREVITIINKADLDVKIDPKRLREQGLGPILTMSLKEGWGLEGLEEIIVDKFGTKGLGMEGALVTNIRHAQALERALGAIKDSRRSVAEGWAEDFICIDLREALESLGEITGETVQEGVLDEIFSRFCIGK